MTKLNPQAKEYSKFLIEREGFKPRTASFFAKQIQEFNESGMTPKGYFESTQPQDERAAETFLLNFRHFVQFQTMQYFEDFNQKRWDMGRKHVKGGF
ncbi:hypothetical protein [Terrihalobacillus insolitus]|uniref:hypothetical protein n=1 Tax=Terrihalobacillus insolitus TaxID=2950438 RepID=UPI00234224DF|nr:hypothetical protein [Terrihalobacillus insolitus]MDC3413916.1 hypothetical protein [Terrihalobacillus insolitus]